MVVCFANAACGADAGTATAAPARTNAEQSIPGLCWYRHTQRASGPCPRALDPTLRSCCFSHAGADPQVPQKEAHRDEGRIQTPAYVTVDDPGLPLPQTLRRRSEPDLECRADSLVRVNYIADGACRTFNIYSFRLDSRRRQSQTSASDRERSVPASDVSGGAMSVALQTETGKEDIQGRHPRLAVADIQSRGADRWRDAAAQTCQRPGCCTIRTRPWTESGTCISAVRAPAPSGPACRCAQGPTAAMSVSTWTDMNE